MTFVRKIAPSRKSNGKKAIKKKPKRKSSFGKRANKMATPISRVANREKAEKLKNPIDLTVDRVYLTPKIIEKSNRLADHGKWKTGSKSNKLPYYFGGAPVSFRANPTNNLKIDLEKIDPEVEEMREKLKEHALLAADASKYRRSKKELHTKYKIDATRFEADLSIERKKNRKLTDIAAHAYKHMDEKQRVLLQKTADRGSDDRMKAQLRNCSLLDVKDQDIGILRKQLAESKAETKLALESKKV